MQCTCAHKDDNDTVVKTMNEHNHGSDAAAVAVQKIVTGIKRVATETAEIPSVIVNRCLEGIAGDVLAKMPNKEASRKLIQRHRNVTTALPSQPVDRASIVIPEQYEMYEERPGHEERFLLWDSGVGDADRILIFGRYAHGDWAEHMDKLFVDGTFSLAPALFSQIYVIMAERGGFVLPVLYALLPNKGGDTYKGLFAAVKEMWPDLNPSSVSMDYELAAIGAV